MIVTENVTSTIMTTLPDSTEFTTVVDTSTTQSTLTSCGHICTKSSGNPNSEDTLSSIGSSQSVLKSESEDTLKSFIIRTKTETTQDTTTFPTVTESVTTTTTEFHTVIEYTD